MTLQIRPMLAAKKLPCKTPLWTPKHELILAQHLAEDGYLLGQPKIDGMRYMFHEGVCYSRSWTPWRNQYVQAFAQDHNDFVQGWDCEAIPGHVYDQTIFNQAQSALTSEDGTKEFTLYVFDNFDPSWAKRDYKNRFRGIAQDIGGQYFEDPFQTTVKPMFIEGKNYSVQVILCPTKKLRSVAEIYEHEVELLALKWEGEILRRWRGPYKYNRSTPREGYLVAVKRFKDGEALITGFIPRYSNQNELQTSALGYAKRTAHQEGLVEQDTLGAIECRLMVNGEVTDIEFKIGVFNGVDEALRKAIWDARHKLKDQLVRFKDQDYNGGYVKPRTPVFHGFRNPIDL